MARKRSLSTFDTFDDATATPVLPGIAPSDPLAVAADSVQFQFSHVHVPNAQPTLRNQAYKIAVIGDQPHKADAFHQKPFATQGTPDYPYSGAASTGMSTRMSYASIAKDACFLGNVCQYTGLEVQMKKNDFSHQLIQESITKLHSDLDEFDPNVCILMGRAALYLAKGETNVDAWRGSVFIGDLPGPFFGRKCITTYHPQTCLGIFSNFALMSFDFRRAAGEARTKTFLPPLRDLCVDTDLHGLLSKLESIKSRKPKIALDIEGWVDAMSCVSIAESPDKAFIVPIAHKNNDNLYHSLEDELLVWRALAAILEDPLIPKVLQNSLYDRFVLQYSYGIVVRGIVDDTMLKHWELYCEFEKSLGFQASIYTNEPYYKADRHTPDIETFYRYCCRDSAVTLEISNRLDRMLAPTQVTHYKFNVALLNALLYMENRGISYDLASAQICLRKVQDSINVLQSDLDRLSGKGLPAYASLHDLLAKVQTVMCWKKDISKIKSDYVEIYPRIKQLLADCLTSNREPTLTELTEISIECDFSQNIKSASFKKLLYEDLGLPVQYKKNKETGELAPTTDYEALLKLQKIQPTKVVELALQIGTLRTRAQMLRISADKDGRVRCGYNIVGTETGRLTCYTSPTGSGYNLQTIPSEDASKPKDHPLHEGMRHLFKADPGYHMFQCDLSGADGWTVAARCAALGDRTLLDDYLAGIKPAKVLCYMLRHGPTSLQGKSRQEIKHLTNEVKKEDWDYFACKCGQHGSCYLMGPQRLADLIFVQSEGTILLSVKEVKELQNLFFIRYRVKMWHEDTQRRLKIDPSITTVNGYKRKFYGRPTEILSQALAHEPQAVTTYATNLAMYRLWTDPDNRRSLSGENDNQPMRSSRVRLRIEPLHQVHDALVGQFRIEDTPWAINKIKSYFANEMTIANIKLVIPFEGNYGESWGNLTVGNI